MKVEFDRSFEKAVKKLKDSSLKSRILKVILSVEKANTFAEVKNLRKMSGFSTYYRIRVGDYRIGIEATGAETVRFITIAHRKDIYSVFP